MRRLRLHYDPTLSGGFTLKKVNLLFVFQVNCPGCFFYGIPMMNLLFERFEKDVGFLGLSTAFEDFEFNTLENTANLISSGTVIGETRKAMLKAGHSNFPEPIKFPVAMDAIADEKFDFKEAARSIVQLNPNYSIWSKYDQELLLDKVEKYLVGQKKISKTFTLNQLKGTPSFVVFDENKMILSEWFGHKHPAEIYEMINIYL